MCEPMAAAASGFVSRTTGVSSGAAGGRCCRCPCQTPSENSNSVCDFSGIVLCIGTESIKSIFAKNSFELTCRRFVTWWSPITASWSFRLKRTLPNIVRPSGSRTTTMSIFPWPIRLLKSTIRWRMICRPTTATHQRRFDYTLTRQSIRDF